MEFSVTSIISLILVGIVALKLLGKGGKKKLNLPGPAFSFPILGHLPFFDAEVYFTFTRWKKIYGNMFAVSFAGTPCMVLNDVKLIKEAFKQPAFVGRQKVDFVNQTAYGKDVVFFTGGPATFEQRDFVSKSMKYFGASTKFLEHNILMEVSEAVDGLENFVGMPVSMKHYFNIPILNAIWSLFMGQRFDTSDPKLKELSQAVTTVMSTDGALIQLAVLMPWLGKLVPEYSGINDKVRALTKIYDFMQGSFDEPIPEGRVQGQPRNFKEAFVDQMEVVGQDASSSFHPTKKVFAQTCGAVLIAAIDTTSISLEWFLIYMVRWPEVQKKLQKEIDEVIKDSRNPYLSDRSLLPYTDACVSELLRYSSVAPVGSIPLRAEEDSEFRNYFIPKDTLVLGNIYGVHHDPEIWGDPHNFRPERFLEGNASELKSNLLPFSTGKRRCIGEYMGRDQLFLYITHIFQKYSVEQAEVLPSLEGIPGFLRSTKPFKVTFRKRV